jgi:hypothetical protein
LADPTKKSPEIASLSWGKVELKDGRVFKDAKLFPGGGREWDWAETGTAHSPGIGPQDVAELLQHGARVVVLSQGMLGRLEVCPETVDTLEERGVVTHVMRTKRAVKLYNELCTTDLVGALIHSTC